MHVDADEKVQRHPLSGLEMAQAQIQLARAVCEATRRVQAVIGIAETLCTWDETIPDVACGEITREQWDAMPKFASAYDVLRWELGEVEYRRWYDRMIQPPWPVAPP